MSYNIAGYVVGWLFWWLQDGEKMADYLKPSLSDSPVIHIHLDRPEDNWCQQYTELPTSFSLTMHDLGGIINVVITKSELSHPAVEVVNVRIYDHHLVKWSLDIEV